MDHPLDRPAWSALTTGWREWALGDGAALRLAPEYGPFAAAADASPESLAALAALDPGETGLWLIEGEPLAAPPPGMAAAPPAPCVQMVAQAAKAAPPPAFEIVPLTEADAGEMFALATLTRPGPFAARTHRLGGFIGVKQEGRLVAMAGERMRMPGFTEVSGVCTHPDHRGHGYAGGLMRQVMAAVQARGETPFLHAYSSNTGAIRLYESLGFALRREVVMTVLTRA